MSAEEAFSYESDPAKLTEEYGKILICCFINFKMYSTHALGIMLALSISYCQEESSKENYRGMSLIEKEYACETNLKTSKLFLGRSTMQP